MKAKKILSLIIALAMIMSTMSISVLAENSQAELGGASFEGDDVVYDGNQYYVSLTKALAGIHGTDNAVLYCKPDADLGAMTHGHVCKNLTIYGNGAYISSGEKDFEIDAYVCPGIGPGGSGLTGDVTLKVYNLTGAGAWGTRQSDYTVNYIFEGCKDMGKVYLTGTNGVSNITLTDCTFTSNDVSNCKVYSNQSGTITLTDVDFSNVDKAVNLNHKASSGVQNVILDGCTFTNCGNNVDADEIPVRVLSSQEGAMSILSVNDCTFTGTPAGGSDILLDDGEGNTIASVSGTAATVFDAVANEEKSVAANETLNVATVEAKIGDTYYTTFEDAISVAASGDTIEIVSDLTIASGEEVAIENINVTAPEGITFTLDGTFDVYGECTLNFAKVTGEETFNFRDGAIINNSYINGGVFVAGNVIFRGDNTFNMIYDYGTLTDYYGTTAPMKWTVESGASVTLLKKDRYGLGYGDDVTINGTLTNAKTARANLTEDDMSLFMHGLVGMESKGWNCNSSITINNAYVTIGNNNSFGNKPGNYGGVYTYNINNSVVDNSRITFYEAISSSTFNITDSDVEMSGVFMTNDADSVFNLTNSKVVSKATSNGNDESNTNAGVMNLSGSELVYNAPVTNKGTIKMDLTSTITAPSIKGAGTIQIDASNYDGISSIALINADTSEFTGNIEFLNTNKELTTQVIDGKVVMYSNTPACNPIIGYTSENTIWGETRANAKTSYVVKVYSNDTFLGESSLNNIGGIIDGDVNVTWNINLDAQSNTDEYWTMSWTQKPSKEYQPTHVALWVDGVEVSKSPIQLNSSDNLKKIYAAILDADGYILSYATSLEKAFEKVGNGETILLVSDVSLDNTIVFTKDMTITVDGNGHIVKPSKKFSSTDSAFNFGQGNDSTAANKKYDIKNIIFDGWKTNHVLRLQGTTSTVDNCTFRNCNQTAGLGLLTLTFTDADVINCTFENNTCIEAIDVNSWGDNSALNNTIVNCVFRNNTANSPALVLYSDGASLEVKDSKFISNTVNTTANGATLYMGFNNGIKVTGNLFEDNAVVSSDNTERVRIAGAVFAGFADDNCVITHNAFIDNTAVSDSYPVGLPSGVAYSAYYKEGNLDGNYWGGGEPVPGIDYNHEYAQINTLTVEQYYDDIEIDADGNFTLSDYKPVVAKNVAVQFVLNEEDSNANEGLKVYDIVIVTVDDHIINRLNTADLTFVLSSDKVNYEISAADDITLTHNTDFPHRYMFNFDGKDDVEDTAREITIGQVHFTGYDSFTFRVAEVETDIVTTTTIDNNIVTTFKNGAGLTLNTDTDGDGKYLGFVDATTDVPTKTLTINIDFPNAVKANVAAYQEMKVEITGVFDGVNQTIKYDLGETMDNGSYVVKNSNLVLNNAYTVTVSGAGYRTTRYTVTMTTDKKLRFWNNVMDEAQVVEIGKGSSEAYVTFLAGDIVKDNVINIYDLSAVVSYFGTPTETSEKSEYVKYDLNRDGIIDSKDVAYVLVSWGK